LLLLFWRWEVLQTICPGWPRTTILPISASSAQLSSISLITVSVSPTAIYHPGWQRRACGFNRICLTIYPKLTELRVNHLSQHYWEPPEVKTRTRYICSLPGM
jgi:hypothetical protein